MSKSRSIKLLTGNSHPELARLVAERLGVPLCKCTVKKFSDGNETSVSIGESVREEDVYILQTGFNPNPSVMSNGFSRPPSPSASRTSDKQTFTPEYQPAADPNDLLMELFIMISACKTASARRITAVLPCFPYSRMDRKDRSRAPITAKLVANMLQIAGCDHVITLDLHASQIQGFFEIPVDNLWTEPVMLKYIKTEIPDWRNSIIVSPDAGGAKRATMLADRLGVDFALINRKRMRNQKSGQDSEDNMEILVGHVKAKVAILIDDMCDTGETLALATKALQACGVAKIYAIVSHGLLSGTSIKTISNLAIDSLVASLHTNTKHRLMFQGGKLQVMDISPILAESIRRTHNGASTSPIKISLILQANQSRCYSARVALVLFDTALQWLFGRLSKEDICSPPHQISLICPATSLLSCGIKQVRKISRAIRNFRRMNTLHHSDSVIGHPKAIGDSAVCLEWPYD